MSDRWTPFRELAALEGEAVVLRKVRDGTYDARQISYWIRLPPDAWQPRKQRYRTVGDKRIEDGLDFWDPERDQPALCIRPFGIVNVDDAELRRADVEALKPQQEKQDVEAQLPAGPYHPSEPLPGSGRGNREIPEEAEIRRGLQLFRSGKVRGYSGAADALFDEMLKQQGRTERAGERPTFTRRLRGKISKADKAGTN